MVWKFPHTGIGQVWSAEDLVDAAASVFRWLVGLIRRQGEFSFCRVVDSEEFPRHNACGPDIELIAGASFSTHAKQKVDECRFLS